jgi:hypothetical protein
VRLRGRSRRAGAAGGQAADHWVLGPGHCFDIYLEPDEFGGKLGEAFAVVP